MVDEQSMYDQLWHQFHELSAIDEMLKYLQDLNHAVENQGLPLKERYDLQVQVFKTLRELTLKNSEAGQKIILEELLPHCLTYNSEIAYELSRHRDCLVDWLNQYPEVTRYVIRDCVIQHTLSDITSEEPRPACWLISRIGYRTDEILAKLWELVGEDNDEAGDTALSTLASLGILKEHQMRIQEELGARMAQRQNHSLRVTASRLANASVAQMIREYWLGDVFQTVKGFETDLLLSTLFSILGARSSEPALQDEVWQWIKDLAIRSPVELSRDIQMSSSLAPSCNSPQIIPTMLIWLGESTGEEEAKAPLDHYLIGLRLEECIRPRQLEGWHVPLMPPTLEVLKTDACRDTGKNLFSTSTEDLSKRQAWETILRTGNIAALSWFDAAVVQETGKFMQQQIMEWFACFRLNPLPEFAKKLIQEAYDYESSGKDSRELAPRQAATRMARSTASREAFETLLQFGLTIDGKALLHSVQAVAETALYLVQNGDTTIVNDIVSVAFQQTASPQRGAAVYALERIASYDAALVDEYFELLIPALYDHTRSDYERSYLVSILKYVENWEISPDLVQDIKEWACNPGKWLGTSSLEVLAQRSFLQNDVHLLGQVLGLQQVEEQWDLMPNANHFRSRPHIIGLLYSLNVDGFAPAISSLIKTLDRFTVPQVYEWLLFTHRETDTHPSVPQTIQKALVQRIYERQSSALSDTEIFEVLAKLTPELLASEDWPAVWSDWMDYSRMALADAIGKATFEPFTTERAILWLEKLAGDSQYGVRRSVYRALARQSMEALYRLCLSWSGLLKTSTELSMLPAVALRQRAAEAIAWLDDTAMFDELYQTLSTDVERAVRDTALETQKEHRERSWAAQYLDVILRVQGRDNQEILDAWCYGEALVRIGDDAALEALSQHLQQNTSLPPNLRYWIQRIANDLQKNWRKKTQKWPDPWFAWEGTVEAGEGKLVISPDKIHIVKYSVWVQPGSLIAGSTPSRWGGVLWPVNIMMPRNHQTCILHLENSQQGEILINQISGDKVIFVGQGEYPK